MHLLSDWHFLSAEKISETIIAPRDVSQTKYNYTKMEGNIRMGITTNRKREKDRNKKGRGKESERVI